MPSINLGQIQGFRERTQAAGERMQELRITREMERTHRVTRYLNPRIQNLINFSDNDSSSSD